MTLKVVMQEIKKPVEIIWSNAKQGRVYRCVDNKYLVICNQANQASGLELSGAASRKLGETWSPAPSSTWIEVDATITVTGDV